MSLLTLRGHPGIGAKVTGRALVAADGFSARYDLDRIKGVFSRPTHKLAGQSYLQRILVLDTAKGGVATAWMLRDMAARRIVPLALLFNRVNPIIAQGAAFGAVPLMDRFEGDVTALLHTGDLLALDPEAGTVTVLEKGVRLMATYLICYGAWSAGWAWKKMRPLLRAAGHDIFTPSYTGLGERAHLASPMVGLDTHIADMFGVIEAEDLHDLVLVGHSYGGMVATGVADRVPDRIRHLVYLDAFVPGDGQSLDDLRGGNPVAAIEGWLVPPMPPAPDTAPEDLAWTGPRRRHHPARCFTDRLHLTGAVNALRRTYNYCAKKGPGDVFVQFRDRFRDDPAWRYLEMNESHSPNVTAPDALARVLMQAA